MAGRRRLHGKRVGPELRARVERRRARSRVPGVREGTDAAAVDLARRCPRLPRTRSRAPRPPGRGHGERGVREGRQRRCRHARGARAGAWGREAPLTAARTAAMVCLRGETDEEKSFADATVFRVFVPAALGATVLPATSERCRWSAHVALARARARKQPVHSPSHSKCLSVRLSSRTRTCPRCVSVASAVPRGFRRFRAETGCLCGLSSLPPRNRTPSGDRPERGLDRPWDARLTAFIPPHCCFANNRTSSRMPWTAPPRCVSSKTRVRRLLELTNERTARVFLTGGGRVIASLAIDHARSRHRRRDTR